MVSVTQLPERAIVLAVEGYVEQILHNLLSNAYKYSPENTPIDVCAQVEGDFVQIRVADRGRGVKSPESLFVAFSREDDEDGTVPGLGVGLAVCKRLVEVQGGEMQVESREGGGTIFSFTLPLDKSGKAS